MTKNVLLTCGAGASSGFMAAAARKATKKMEVDLNFTAKSESEVEGLLPEVDVLLVAPHLKYMLADIQEIAEKNNVICDAIPQRIYGMLDGKALVTFVQEKLGK